MTATDSDKDAGPPAPIRERQAESGEGTISNVEVVVLAVALLGGAEKPVDTEDVAVRANKLAPGRFVWRRHRAQISIELVRVYLSDAKKQKNGRLLAGDGTQGWQLTSAGLELSLRVRERIRGAAEPRQKTTRLEARRRRAETDRICGLPAWEKHLAGVQISRRESEAVFRLTRYVTGARRKALIDRVRLLFVQNPPLDSFLREMAALAAAPAPRGTDDDDQST